MLTLRNSNRGWSCNQQLISVQYPLPDVEGGYMNSTSLSSLQEYRDSVAVIESKSKILPAIDRVAKENGYVLVVDLAVLPGVVYKDVDYDLNNKVIEELVFHYFF